jgi:acetoacetate decarboxylase
MWLSLFVLRSTGRPDRPAGLYGAALVDYQEGSELLYRELLVARPVRAGRWGRVRVTDIWVDDEESRAGGRSLWGLPKEMAHFDLVDEQDGQVARTSFEADTDGTRLAAGSFTSLPGAALVRTPFASSTWQVRDDGTEVIARMSGSARSLPCRGTWDFSADGALGWLAGRKPLVSFRLTDMKLTFGA